MIRSTFSAIQGLSPTCRQAAMLISQSEVRRLSRLERVGLTLHLMICHACRAYRHSVRVLGELMRRTADAAPPRQEHGSLPDTARERILQHLRHRR